MRPSTKIILQLSPVLLPFILVFTGGLFLAGAQSFGFFLPLPVEGGMFEAYARLLAPHYLASFLFSLHTAFFSALLSTVIGTLLAYAVWRMPESLQRFTPVYKILLILPHIAAAFIILLLFSKSGLISALGHHAGLVERPADFPSLLYGGNGAGMILAYVYKETPFVMLMALAVLKRLDPRLIQTAVMLGASRTTAFMKVVLPHLMPTCHTVFIIFFLYSFGAFEVPFLLGESSPAMLSIEVYNLYFKMSFDNRPEAMALLVLMFLFSTGFIALYVKVAATVTNQERAL